MLELFHKGGPIMWPLLLASVVVVTVSLERLFFSLVIRRGRNPSTVQTILRFVNNGLFEEAVDTARGSRDFVARMLSSALEQRAVSVEQALHRAAGKELKRFAWGTTILDTIITLAPLLGLLGTVTGMIRAFGLLGDQELEAPTVITGGIAEALIATAFGLAIAIVALIPFNFLNSQLDEARLDLEEAGTQLELAMRASVDSGKQERVAQG